MPVAAPWPHDGASVEWWFVHGNFYAAGLSGHFMLSIFRHDLDGEHSFSMLFRLEDSARELPYIVSRADGRVKDLLARSKEELYRTNLDANLLKIYFEEVEKYGLPRSQSSTDLTARFGEENFSIVWGDFTLAQHDGDLMVNFCPPWTKAETRLVIRSRTPEVDLDELVTPGEKKMGYLTYPCCDLFGSYEGAAVSGSAWFDHQWGDMSWFASEDSSTGQKRLLGWDWFGINFNDGRAAIVLIHRDMETKKILTSNLVMIDENGATQIMTDFQVEPLRFWYSPKTCILYPVEWKISIPSLDGEWIFVPRGDDQEIPVAGATRAIWEGAGHVCGTLAGRPVSGTARLELNGYGYVFHLSDVLDNFSRRIFRHIENFFPEAPDEKFFEKCTGFAPEQGNVDAVRDFLTRPMWDLLHRGGKYWRPMFGILMAEVLGIHSTRYEDLLSVSTELTHLASLVIDDIEDNALTRRKEACIHLKYGTDVAINAANTLYFLPILKLRENAYITDEQQLAIYAKTMEFFVKAHFGQGLDISRKAAASLAGGGDPASLIRDSLNVYALKSAASVEFVTYTACIVGDATPATTEALVGFARSFGISFQIKDDVHDFGSAGIWTKEPGADLACGKLTYVILLALEALTGEEREFLVRLLCKEIPSSADHIDRGMQLVRRSGALEKANAKVLSLLYDAWDNLCRVVPQSDARIMLKVMCEHLLKLDFDSFDITA
jgi:geranylgeranyl pyrophosphate synthase